MSMKEIIIESTEILIEIIKSYLVFWGIFKFNTTRKWHCYAAGAAVFLLGAGFVQLPDIEDGSILVVTMVRLACMILLFEGKIKNKILLFIPMYVCVYVADVAVSVIIAFVLKEDLLGMWQNSTIIMFVNLINVFVFGMLGVFRRREFKTMELAEGKSPLYYYLVPVIGMLGMILMGGVQWSLVDNSTNSKIITIISTILVCLFLFLLSISLIRIWDLKNYYMNINQLNDELLSVQKKYYKDLYDSNQDIRRFKHDYNAHMRSLKSLSDSKEYEKLQKYINDLAGGSIQTNKTIHTGSYMADAIINEMVNQLDDDMKFECCGVLPENLNISEMDLCTIFSNALNNAIEACRKVEENTEKLIEVEFKKFNNYLYISIENPVSTELNIVNGRLQTDKKDKSRHGFGTVNMKKAVEKNGGEIEWVQDKGKCRVNISFECRHA